MKDEVMEDGDKVRILAKGTHHNLIAEFIGQGPEGVAVKLPESSTILTFPRNEIEPVPKLSLGDNSNPFPQPA